MFIYNLTCTQNILMKFLWSFEKPHYLQIWQNTSKYFHLVWRRLLLLYLLASIELLSVHLLYHREDPAVLFIIVEQEEPEFVWMQKHDNVPIVHSLGIKTVLPFLLSSIDVIYKWNWNFSVVHRSTVFKNYFSDKITALSVERLIN